MTNRIVICCLTLLVITGGGLPFGDLSQVTNDRVDAATKKKKKITITSGTTNAPAGTSTPRAQWSTDEQAWLKQLNGTKIQPQKVFSYRKWMGQQKKLPELTIESQEKLASLLYEASLVSSLVIGERNQRAKEMDVVGRLGFDVSLQSEKFDLTFMNDFKGEMKLTVTMGNGGDPTLTWSSPGDKGWKALQLDVFQQTIPAPTQLVMDATLPSGSKVIRSEGVPGILVKVYGVNAGGTKRLLTRDFYAPRPQVVAKGKTETQELLLQ